MSQTLIEVDNHYALIIDKRLLEEIGAGPDSEFEITVADGALIIKPVQNVGLGRERVEASLARLRPRYTEMLDHLAH
jgi:antitoxin component of MazEF toxin-antitoxin module